MVPGRPTVRAASIADPFQARTDHIGRSPSVDRAPSGACVDRSHRQAARKAIATTRSDVPPSPRLDGTGNFQ